MEMAGKYYAVRKGRKQGVFFSWEECKKQIDGFSGAEYKSFKEKKEAENFAFPKNCFAVEEAEKLETTKELLVVYVDGSYSKEQKRYAYGCVILLPEETVTLSGSGQAEDYVDMRNVAGEILGSQAAVEWAILNHYKSIVIHYDYEGIEKWANGIWKANKTGTRAYARFISEKRKEIEIRFVKVPAHSGVKYNEMADQLAKGALKNF